MKYIFQLILVVLVLLPTKFYYEHPPKTLVSTKELNKQITCVQSALHAEARGEPPEGIKAVLSVIYNRTKHKDYPSDFCAVIKQPYQFSYLNGGKSVVKPTYKPSEHKVKATIDQLAFEAAIGCIGLPKHVACSRLKPSLEPTYLFYHATKLKKIPKWSKKAKNMVIIGNHIFIGA